MPVVLAETKLQVDVEVLIRHEKIFCELVSLHINEVDTETCQGGVYKEKMEINIVLKILLYQQVPLFMGAKKNRKHNKHHC